MTSSYVQQRFPIEGGEVRVTIVRDSPIPAWFYEGMAPVMQEASDLANTLPEQKDVPKPGGGTE